MLKKTIQIIIIFILCLSFLISIIVGVIAYKNPQLAIEFLENITPSTTPSPVSLRGVAIIGDSQSDEYRADDNRGANYSTTTLNWVELLTQERKINFGKWGEWEEPRRTGYEYNWARTGATARSMIESGQHTGVAEQVRTGKVNVVVIYIGAIDYAPLITGDGYEKIYNSEMSDAAIVSKRNRIVADIKTAVDVIERAGDPRILLVKIPDWGNNLGVQIAFPFPNQRRIVTDAVNETNKDLQRLADTNTIATLDPNTFFQMLEEEKEGTKLTVGSVKLERLLLNNDPHNMFLEDGVHTGTVLNGLFANEIGKILHSSYNISIMTLSDDQILNAAGIRK